MRKAKVYPNITKQIYHAEIRTCPTCGTRLRRYATVSQRIVVTLEGVIKLVHCGYRCPHPACPTASRPYRSTLADGLALPGFTFGLDVVLLVGHLRLAQHQTVDELHETLQARLSPFGVTISRREILYLFDAYSTLLRASQSIADDSVWQAQTHTNGGVILSIDGIQPDKGSETIYLVRDVVTGRLLAAENVRSSDTPTITALLQPIRDLGVPVVGAVSDAQESLLQAIAALWPDIPHQVCQFHYLREASRPMFDVDRKVRKQIRKELQQDIRMVRRQLEVHTTRLDLTDTDDQRTATQIAILDDYALAAQTALNLDALQPFQYASPAVDDALGAIATSLEGLKKGALPPPW
jgi:Transposase, Mutator family